jgi:hypothetical protein
MCPRTLPFANVAAGKMWLVAHNQGKRKVPLDELSQTLVLRRGTAQVVRLRYPSVELHRYAVG